MAVVVKKGARQIETSKDGVSAYLSQGFKVVGDVKDGETAPLTQNTKRRGRPSKNQI